MEPREGKSWVVELIRSAFSRLTSRQFLIVSGIVVALWTSIFAILLKVTVHQSQEMLMNYASARHWLYFLAPATGIFLSIMVVRFLLGGGLQKGTYHVMASITKGSSRLPKKETYGHLITSGLTVGLGGSAGLESPIVQTGAAIGSTYSSLFSITYRDRTILLACGAAAGIATAFNAPIAGVLFALEVLMVDIGISSFIPILIAAAVGALCSNIILADGIALSFESVTPFNYRNTFYYVLLGLTCGFVSAGYLKSFASLETVFGKIFKSSFWRYVICCAILGLTILVFPPLFGEGYAFIKSLASNKPEMLFDGSLIETWTEGRPILLYSAIFAIALVKVIAVSTTLNAGGNGGNFAPSLLIGACVGFSFAAIANHAGWATLPLSNFSVVAMAGVLTGIFHAPLTAIFLIAEITGGYDLIIPLMIVGAISTAISKYFSPRSLDEAKLYKAVLRESSISGKDVQILSQLSVAEILERDFVAVRSGSTLRTLTELIGKSKRSIFPVLDENGALIGVISLEDIREIMFNVSLYDSTVVDKIMRAPAVTVDIKEEMDVVVEKFDKSGVWNIPVLDSRRYVGFISKSAIFSSYRDRLRENHR